MKAKDKLEEYVYEKILKDIEEVDFGEELEGSNDLYAIRPAVTISMSGQPAAVYGIYNKTTNVMEAETRQIVPAREWVQAFTAMASGEEVPGNMVKPAQSDSDPSLH